MSTWTVNFIFAIMIIILIQFLSPGGKFDKHIKLAASLVFVIAVFIPAVEMIKNGDIESEFLKTSLFVDTVQLNYDSSNAEKIYKSTLLTNYKTNLSASMITQVKKNMEFDGDIALEIIEDENNEDFGDISRVTITTDKKIDEEKLKNVLNNFYNINKDNIYINVNNEEK